jgi:hypothetical protein
VSREILKALEAAGTELRGTAAEIKVMFGLTAAPSVVGRALARLRDDGQPIRQERRRFGLSIRREWILEPVKPVEVAE